MGRGRCRPLPAPPATWYGRARKSAAAASPEQDGDGCCNPTVATARTEACHEARCYAGSQLVSSCASWSPGESGAGPASARLDLAPCDRAPHFRGKSLQRPAAGQAISRRMCESFEGGQRRKSARRLSSSYLRSASRAWTAWGGARSTWSAGARAGTAWAAGAGTWTTGAARPGAGSTGPPWSWLGRASFTIEDLRGVGCVLGGDPAGGVARRIAPRPSARIAARHVHPGEAPAGLAVPLSPGSSPCSRARRAASG